MLQHIQDQGLHMLTKVRLRIKSLNVQIYARKIVLTTKFSKLFAKHRMFLEGDGGDFNFLAGRGGKGKIIVILSVYLPLLIHKQEALY